MLWRPFSCGFELWYNKSKQRYYPYAKGVQTLAKKQYAVIGMGALVQVSLFRCLKVGLRSSCH